MPLSNPIEFASIGIDDEGWKSLPRDEARSLLCIFTVQDNVSQAFGTVLVTTPNGKKLYVTPQVGSF